MSKLVEGIKDRMVAAAREAAPAVVDAAQKAATAAAEKVAEAVADAKNAAGETLTADAATPNVAESVTATAAHAPEGAIFNPEAARGNLHLGIDVGSTTVKLAVLNDDNQIVYAKYQRHHTDVRACARDLFEGAATVLPTAQMTCAITGSGGLLLSQWLDLEFVQEVIASKRAVETLIPATDVAIELGGEDAKIIYFDNGIEQRMNGTCAGGTGAFIDQMATLLHTDASGLNELAANATTIYPIASRCGVFAKTDVQPLLNEGARPEDVAASIFQAVVTQTISGLACGRPIRGNVAFLGGPLQYLSELRHRFYLTLNLDEEHRIVPQNAHLFVASGAAMAHESNKLSTFPQLIEAIDSLGDTQGAEVERLDPLFATDEDFAEFKNRHDQEVVPKGKLDGYTGRVFIGIDAGSTTMKAALVGEDGHFIGITAEQTIFCGKRIVFFIEFPLKLCDLLITSLGHLTLDKGIRCITDLYHTFYTLGRCRRKFHPVHHRVFPVIHFLVDHCKAEILYFWVCWNGHHIFFQFGVGKFQFRNGTMYMLYCFL